MERALDRDKVIREPGDDDDGLKSRRSPPQVCYHLVNDCFDRDFSIVRCRLGAQAE